MTYPRRRLLSRRAHELLVAIRDAGPADAYTAELQSAVPSANARFESLLVLQARSLIRWDEGGGNIRITKSGQQLLSMAVYRNR